MYKFLSSKWRYIKYKLHPKISCTTILVYLCESKLAQMFIRSSLSTSLLSQYILSKTIEPFHLDVAAEVVYYFIQCRPIFNACFCCLSKTVVSNIILLLAQITVLSVVTSSFTLFCALEFCSEFCFTPIVPLSLEGYVYHICFTLQFTSSIHIGISHSIQLHKLQTSLWSKYLEILHIIVKSDTLIHVHDDSAQITTT